MFHIANEHTGGFLVKRFQRIRAQCSEGHSATCFEPLLAKHGK